MKKYERLHPATKFENIKDMIENAVKLYPNNNAFIIKHKNGKEVTYENITYSRFQEEINALGTGLLNLGLKDKRIAIIGKNCYEWALTYVTTLNGVGVAVPLDKSLPENEIELLYMFEKHYLDINHNKNYYHYL